jgi:RNase P/RNase MRP subunit p29
MSRQRNHDLVEIAGKVRGETAAAYRFHDGERTVWLPKSQCQWDPDAATMEMPEWLATEKELV